MCLLSSRRAMGPVGRPDCLGEVEELLKRCVIRASVLPPNFDWTGLILEEQRQLGGAYLEDMKRMLEARVDEGVRY